ncbi:Cyclic di-GMP phosphodiesterase response regulator RpfG [Pseudodesulfovibrio hydrargyri]|uniref:Cyclic di-GMP phosphodiesterase response regulator RpfG n=1 Tax=Pseudodesulfovibrio hydrargyri TaxID=2125990 RepID=A0A1J5N8T0_9BACT|nr:HD domain-containing phosphohydrolase [Pseudodesulfovibrio hydrargyri]OIQ49695.1 Cyclic di-GMP phosphodiesterase response regulator RpfG [Pseudodesulfovibrio hydrargyri]
MEDVSLIDIAGGISTALDYISPTVTGHHRRVGLASALLGNRVGIKPSSLVDLLLAGLLHDIGAFSMDLALDGLSFDADLEEHAVVGYRLLKDHPFLERPSRMVLYHHTSWRDLRVIRQEGDRETLLLANIVNLADRVDILRRMGAHRRERSDVERAVAGFTSDLYAPELTAAFRELTASGLFWPLMEDMDMPVREMLSKDLLDVRISPDQLIDFSGFFTRIIDFRSRHTATHSAGVAETAVLLARLAGMDEKEQKAMRLAGNLHDIGKLAVPTSLLDKQSALDDDEYTRIKDHATVSAEVLRAIPGLGEVADWAAQHHERLNGKGYPLGLTEKELSLGSRIMQVADVHTAITEDRPYRKGMTRERTVSVLRSMADSGFLDVDIVNLVIENHEYLDAVRTMVQSRALSEFRRFTEEIG